MVIPMGILIPAAESKAAVGTEFLSPYPPIPIPMGIPMRIPIPTADLLSIAIGVCLFPMLPSQLTGYDKERFSPGIGYGFL